MIGAIYIYVEIGVVGADGGNTSAMRGDICSFALGSPQGAFRFSASSASSSSGPPRPAGVPGIRRSVPALISAYSSAFAYYRYHIAWW
jgi:hypothetical protein